MSKELITKEEFGVMQSLAKTFMTSGLFKDTQSEAAAIVKMMAGKELNMGPFEAMRNLNVVQGSVTLTSGCIAARIKGSGKYDFHIIKMEDEGCELEFFQNGKSVGFSKFDKADAIAAGLLNKPVWKQYPRNMYFARALTNGARWYCAEVFGGPIYTPEELSKTNAIEIEVSEPPQPPSKAEIETGKAFTKLPTVTLPDWDGKPDENPHFYRVVGFHGCDSEVAGKVIAEIPLKKLQACLKPKFAAFTTEQDKANIKAYLDVLEKQTAKEPTAKERIEAERAKEADEPLPTFENDLPF